MQLVEQELITLVERHFYALALLRSNKAYWPRTKWTYSSFQRVIRSRRSKKDRQYNIQKKKDKKRQNNDPQKTTWKTKVSATRTQLKRGRPRCSGRVSISCFTTSTSRVTLVINPVTGHELRQSQIVFTTSNISVVICDTDIL